MCVRATIAIRVGNHIYTYTCTHTFFSIYSAFKDLPGVPPRTGYQPRNQAYTLVWVQRHYFVGPYEPRISHNWELVNDSLLLSLR